MWLRKIIGFLKKDFLLESSYRFSFFFDIFGILINISIYFFIDRLFEQRLVAHLEEFGVNYFSYVILSSAAFSYIGIGMGSFAERIRSEQVQGTLETILVTPTRTAVLVFSLIIWSLFSATLELFMYITLGIFLFKIDLTHLNILSCIITLLLIIISFSSLGIISASFLIVFKRLNPLSWLIGSLEGLLGGVYFPITVLPGWLQFIARFFPITYAIRAIQLAVYKGYHPMQLSRELGFLFLFSILLLPISIFIFWKSLYRSRKTGTLAHY
ncbi:MAG: ABC transporter permease [Candidatus Omnitrophica bacterium]|nr:ABC transporter permease [Candidatus Omnitrophota bacterium]